MGYFMKDERNISSEWAKVIVRNVTVRDSGLYQCLSYFNFAITRFFAYHFSIGYAIIPCKLTTLIKKPSILVLMDVPLICFLAYELLIAQRTIIIYCVYETEIVARI